MPSSNPLAPLINAIKAARTRIVSLMVPSWQEGQPIYPQVNFENNVRLGYKKNELIFACEQAKANTTASVALKTFSRRTGEEIKDHPLRKLLEKPNRFMGESEFWSVSIINRDLAGMAYWQKLRSRAGNVVELWPMRPDYIRPIPSSGVGISGYKYGPSGENDVVLLAEDVLTFKIWDPLDFYQGLPPVQVASRVADVDNAATDFIKLLWERGTMPPGIFTSKLKLNDQAIADIQRRWQQRYGGYTKWTTPAVLDSDATYQRIGMDFKEMGFEDLDARSEARICMILQVPPIIVGATVGLKHGTMANYESSIKNWWLNNRVPDFKFLADAVNLQLAPEFDDDVFCNWDYTKVPVLQEERTSRWTRASAAYTAGIITRNDARAEMGLGEVPDGDVYSQSNMATTVPAGELDVEPADPAESDEEAGSKAMKAAKDCYVLLDLAHDPVIRGIQDQLKADNPDVEWADPAEFHITLVYAKGVRDQKLAKEVLPTSINELSFDVTGLETFDKPDKAPLLLTVQPSPQMVALQSGLASAFAAIDLELSSYSVPDDWMPHITLGYMPAGTALPKYEGGPVTLKAKTLTFSVENGDGFDVVQVTKAAKPLPHDDLLKVTQADADRWEEMYRAIVRKNAKSTSA
jgi:HK97 family phage portal protein